MAKLVAMDGNMATTHVAHATNEVIAIYPITPSSGMGEISDLKSANGEKNIWGTIPSVTEMQSEGGAAGAVHGALTAGALTTTFTASQGLLLMIPNMFKIAGELTPTVFHVSARAVATHALSIFGDHSDVMACRSTGFAMLISANAQEAMDMALISQAATLKSRVPFLHFFDGFRTSHELNLVEALTFDQMKEMLPSALIEEHKKRGLSPEAPMMRGTAQNPDVFFQSKETGNKFYINCPAIVKEAMAQFEKVSGRKYSLFEYVGAPDAEHLTIAMASGCDVIEEAVEKLVKEGKKVGLLKIRLYRPFSNEDFINAIPKTVKKIAVLDRTKEPGAQGEPLYQDVCTSLITPEGRAKFAQTPVIVGGRYGLGSKEFNPAMAKSVFDNLAADKPKNGFTVGIVDDVTNTSLPFDPSWRTESEDTFRALFYGLGSDGTVGANKNTMKILSDIPGNYAQGYFVYDSKKAGSMTTSHVRVGKKPIRSPYLIDHANFIGIHQFAFVQKYEILDKAAEGAVFLLNTPYGKDEIWEHLPNEVQSEIIKKKLKFYVINASDIAAKTGMGSRVNVIMQTAFFAISEIMPKDKAIEEIKNAVKKTYSKKGEEIVKKNFAAIDETVANIHKVEYPAQATSKGCLDCQIAAHAPKFVKELTTKLMAFKGDDVKVSELPIDGTYPTATTQYEKRNIALEVPEWDPATCIQCGICSLVCPHAVIRMKAYDPKDLEKAPKTFKSADGKADLAGKKVTVQISTEDCTGCGACIYNCPAIVRDANKQPTGKKAINFVSQISVRDQEIENWDFFLKLKNTADLNRETIKGSQLVKPLFEFSGACAGCGETPYIKLLTQLHGDHLAVANATGCSSIYGGNLPTTPYCTTEDGKGPVWSNSLFEDNAEFGMGMRLAFDKFYEQAVELLTKLAGDKKELADAIINNKQNTAKEIEDQRAKVAELKKALEGKNDEESKLLLSLADNLIKKSVWLIGGDGWAYDIGYGGLDHVLASGKKIKALVLDTEVYSNTGGQMSKSTPRGAVAQFAAGGKNMPKKDLAMISMTYGNIYVAQIAMGANYMQAVKALAEAEAYDGPAIVIAYSHCIAHGIDMQAGMNEQKKAVASGRWPLFRFNPSLISQGKNPLTIDSGKATISVKDFMGGENRFKMLMKSKPEVAEKLAEIATKEYAWRLSVYEQLAKLACEPK